MTKCDRSMNAVQYKPTSGRLKQTAEHRTVTEQVEAILKKDWREDGQLPAKFKYHRTAFLKMLGEVESMCHGRLRRIDKERH